MRMTVWAVLALSLTLTACSPDQPAGIVRDPAPEVGGLGLPDMTGGQVAFRGPADGFLLVYFGYTNCPDVCPTTMADVRSALTQLGDDASRFTMSMVTIDPGRDDAAKLDHYVKVFFSNGVGLRTDDDAELRRVADAFGADYLVEMSEEGDTEVSHSAFLYAVDGEGRIRLQWAFGTTPDDLAHDFRLLVDSL